VEGSVALSGKAGSGDGRKPGWRSLLGQFIPGPGPIGSVERVRACAGALLGVLITGFVSRLAFGGGGDLPLLIAPMGASAVLLFVLPASPLAQPWSILGGTSRQPWSGSPARAWCRTRSLPHRSRSSWRSGR
jgi:CBS-domain-containing membrane protein